MYYFEPTQDVVSITFYSQQSLTGYYEGIFSQAEQDNVLRIRNELTKAAMLRGRSAPTIKIYFYLIPDWENEQSLDSESYLASLQKLLTQAQETFGAMGEIIDFLSDGTSLAEVEFLTECYSKGSTADILKTQAIIKHRSHRHLQMDSTTTVSDWQGLYDATLGQEDHDCFGSDSYNASRCSMVYIACHNKIVYVSPGSELPVALKRRLEQYYHQYRSDLQQKSARVNGVYDLVFAAAMHDIDNAYKVTVPDRTDITKSFSFYPAKVHHESFCLMAYIIPAQHQTWRAGTHSSSAVSRLAKLRPVDISGIACDFRHFESLITTFTNIPSWHQKHAEDFSGAEETFHVFVERHDKPVCLRILREYFKYVLTQEDPQLLYALGRTIPATPAGEELCQNLFSFSVKVLHEKLEQLKSISTEEDLSQERFIHQRRFSKMFFTEYSVELTRSGCDSLMFSPHSCSSTTEKSSEELQSVQFDKKG